MYMLWIFAIDEHSLLDIWRNNYFETINIICTIQTYNIRVSEYDKINSRRSIYRAHSYQLSNEI